MSEGTKERPAAREKGTPFEPTPPWAPAPHEIHALWVRGLVLAACAAPGVLAIAQIVRALVLRNPQLLDERWILVLLGSLGLSCFALAAFLRRYWKSHPVERFFQWIDWDMEREQQARARKRARRARERELARTEPQDAAFWTRKLVERLARLKRFVEINAPETVIEKEREMIREAAGKLPPAEALSVMRRWPELATQFDAKPRRKSRDAGPN